MEFPATALRNFIGMHLCIQFSKQGLAEVKIVLYDHSRGLNHGNNLCAAPVMVDTATARFTSRLSSMS